MKYFFAVILAFGLLMSASVGAASAAETSTANYNKQNLVKGTVNDIQVKTNAPVLVRDQNGDPLTDTSGAWKYTNPYPCPGNTSKPCVYVHRFESVIGSNNRKLFYVHPDKDSTQPPGYVISSDFVTQPSITANSQTWPAGNGTAAPDPPGAQSAYSVAPADIPRNFHYKYGSCVGNNEQDGCQIVQYGRPYLNAKAAMMVWSWINAYPSGHMEGGGVGRSIISQGTTFYPSNVKSITTDAYATKDATGTPIGTVTARYGHIRNAGSVQLWGWMVTKHTEKLANGQEVCVSHMGYVSGTQISNMVCNNPQLRLSNEYNVWRLEPQATWINTPQVAQQFTPSNPYIRSVSLIIGASPTGRVMVNIYRDPEQLQLVASKTVTVVPYGETKVVYDSPVNVSTDQPYYLQVIHPMDAYGQVQVYYSLYDDYPNGGAQYNWENNEFSGPDINAKIVTSETPPPDTTPPSAPTGLTGTATGGTSAAINWSNSTDNIGVARYEVFKNGTLLANTSSNAYTASGLTCGTAYSFQVAAVDAAGNRATSSSISVTTSACLQTPVVTITSPTPGFAFASTTATMTFTVTNSPTSVTCAMDSAAPAPCPSPVSAVGLAQGNHVVVVTATNASGTGSATLNFSIDTAAPDTSIISGPAAGSTITAVRPTLGFSSNETGVTYSCWVDNLAAAPCTNPYQEPVQGNGSHTYYVAAKDAAGNVDPTPASRTFNQAVVDTVAPSAPASVAVSTSTKTSATVIWSAATDNIGIAGYNVYKNGAWYAWVPANVYSYTIPGLSCGTAYDTKVVALDVASNYTASPTIGYTTQAC